MPHQIKPSPPKVTYHKANLPNPNGRIGTGRLVVKPPFAGRTCTLGVKLAIALKANKTKATPKTTWAGAQRISLTIPKLNKPAATAMSKSTSAAVRMMILLCYRRQKLYLAKSVPPVGNLHTVGRFD